MYYLIYFIFLFFLYLCCIRYPKEIVNKSPTKLEKSMCYCHMPTRKGLIGPKSDSPDFTNSGYSWPIFHHITIMCPLQFYFLNFFDKKGKKSYKTYPKGLGQRKFIQWAVEKVFVVLQAPQNYLE